MTINSSPLSLQRGCASLPQHWVATVPLPAQGPLVRLIWAKFTTYSACGAGDPKVSPYIMLKDRKGFWDFFTFLGYMQLTARAWNDVSALTELLYIWPDLSFSIWTRFSWRRKGYILETLDTKSVLGEGMGHVPHGPLRKSARRWMDKHHRASRKRGKETLQKPCRAKILKHWIWQGELEAFTTGETKSFQESYARVLVSGSAGADPVHFPRTGRDDFPSGKCPFLASSHLSICMEQNRRSVIAGDTLL